MPEGGQCCNPSIFHQDLVLTDHSRAGGKPKSKKKGKAVTKAGPPDDKDSKSSGKPTDDTTVESGVSDTHGAQSRSILNN